VQEPSAERVEERRVGEPVEVVREDALVAVDGLVGAEPDGLGVREDAAALGGREDVGEEEGARDVRHVEALDGCRRRGRERDGAGRGREEEGGVKVGREAVGGGDGVEERELGGEGVALGGCCVGEGVSATSRRGGRRGEERRGRTRESAGDDIAVDVLVGGLAVDPLGLAHDDLARVAAHEAVLVAVSGLAVGAAQDGVEDAQDGLVAVRAIGP